MIGVIVAIDEYPGFIVLTLDDSSGVNIEAICAAPPRPPDTVENAVKAADEIETMTAVKAVAVLANTSQKLISPDGPDLTDIDVGAIVKMKGSVRIFRGERKLNLKRLQVLGDTNAEVQCWKETIDFKKDVLSKPWVVTDEEERSCREAMDNEARWKKEEEERAKRKELRRQLKEKKRELEEAYNLQIEKDEGRSGKEKNLGKELKAKKRELEEAYGQEVARQPARTEHKSKKDRINHENEKQKEEPFRSSVAVRMRAARKYDALGF